MMLLSQSHRQHVGALREGRGGGEGAASEALLSNRHSRAVGMLMSACAGVAGADRLWTLGAALRAWSAATVALANEAAVRARVRAASEAKRLRLSYATDKLAVSFGRGVGRSLRDAVAVAALLDRHGVGRPRGCRTSCRSSSGRTPSCSSA